MLIFQVSLFGNLPCKLNEKKMLIKKYKTLESIMDGNKRAELKIGSKVKVVQKQDQKSGVLTEGIVTAILTKSAFHPHGIKVRLDNGSVGRVKIIMMKDSQ